MACGIFFLLLLVGGVTVLLIALYRAGRISREVFVGSLVGTGLALLLLLFGIISADNPRHGEKFAVGVGFLLFVAILCLLVCLAVRWLFRQVFFPPKAAVACPPVGRLKDFLVERLSFPEHRQVAAHLEVCPACQHRVEGLTAGQKSWPALARKLTPPPPPEPALKQVIEKLKDVPEEQTRDEKPFAAELPLGFLSPSDKPGQLGRLDRYEVLSEIGRGGMGVVLKAFDPSLHRVVAIKVLAPQLATSGVARKRFLREAKAAAAVTHDHIVTIHAVEESNGLPYLVMQYVAGPSLQERIDKEGPLEVTEIVRIGMETASGLAAAHSHGIVHRDVKPGNILLEDGVQRVKLTDFGLARAMDDASLTQSGFVAGSPLFMAPEQARGEALDPRRPVQPGQRAVHAVYRPAALPGRQHPGGAASRHRGLASAHPRNQPRGARLARGHRGQADGQGARQRHQSAAEVVEILGQRLAQLQHRAWVQPPAPPAPAGSAPAGLPTSLTICPTCGASLQVPESMVGSLVHCPECGKPFEPVNGSEVIQVARAVPSPVGPRPRLQSKISRWLRLLGAGVGLAFALVILGSVIVGVPSVGPMPGTILPPEAARPLARTYDPQGASFWKNTLNWLPAEATLFGALDLHGISPLTLEDDWTKIALRLLAPEEMTARLTPENLGRIRLDGLALAYCEDPRTADAHGIVHLQGVALDGRKRIIDFIREVTAKTVQVEAAGNNELPRKPLRVSGPAFPFALGLYDDNHAFLARSLKKDAGEEEHRKVLEQVPVFAPANGPRPLSDPLAGDNPPWIREALREVPMDLCGICLGEIPTEYRKVLTEALDLRACPRTFVLTLRPQGDGVVLAVALCMDKTSMTRVLQEDLNKWSRQGLRVLQDRYPVLNKEPVALTVVGQTLRSLQWGINKEGDCVRASVQVPGATWRAVRDLLKRATAPGGDRPKGR